MERSFSVGAGTGKIKLYTVSLRAASPTNGCCSTSTTSIPLDNVEGITLGPKLPDGRKSLLLVSDNNFAASQFTQFLLFAID